MGASEVDALHIEMKEMLYLMCEVLLIVLPSERVADLRVNSPEKVRHIAYTRNWLCKNFFIHDSRLYKTFSEHGVTTATGMAKVVLDTFHLWLQENG